NLVWLSHLTLIAPPSLTSHCCLHTLTYERWSLRHIYSVRCTKFDVQCKRGRTGMFSEAYIDIWPKPKMSQQSQWVAHNLSFPKIISGHTDKSYPDILMM